MSTTPAVDPRIKEALSHLGEAAIENEWTRDSHPSVFAAFVLLSEVCGLSVDWEGSAA